MNYDAINSLASFAGIHPAAIAVAMIWALFWKGMGLWRAAELRQKYWFIAILLINTLGILEIFYLYFIARRYKVEVVEKTE